MFVRCVLVVKYSLCVGRCCLLFLGWRMSVVGYSLLFVVVSCVCSLLFVFVVCIVLLSVVWGGGCSLFVVGLLFVVFECCLLMLLLVCCSLFLLFVLSFACFSLLLLFFSFE